jgi:hypothetical protein
MNITKGTVRGAGLREAYFSTIMVGKTRPYQNANYTKTNQSDMI